jgi:signal peptidase I
MKLNLSDEPVTVELLADSLNRTGSATIAVNGNSMHPTLQMGWRIHLEPVRGDQLRIGEIAVFRGDHYLTIHRLVWREHDDSGERLVFRGDYNRVRERVDPAAVIARVVAVDLPATRRGMETITVIEPDILTRFYRFSHALYSLLRPLLPKDLWRTPPGRLGRVARSLFRGAERTLSVFLPQRR